MRILLSKKKMQKLGSRKANVLKKGTLSLIGLCDALAFEAKMLKAGISNIHDYSKSKAARMYLKAYGTSIHPNTIGKYVNTLISVKQAFMEQNCLVFKRIRSNDKRRNHTIDILEETSIKELGKIIASYIFSSSMRSIGYIKELHEKRDNPKNLKELKSARRRMRRLGDDNGCFSDNGVSYDTLQDRFAISRPTVSSMIKLCEKSHIFEKINNKECILIEKATKTIGDVKKFISNIIDDITYWYYSTKEDILRLFKVKANTYIYNPLNLDCLSYCNGNMIY